MASENWERKIRTDYPRQLIAAKAIVDGYARMRETITYTRLRRMIALPSNRPAVEAALLDVISSDTNTAGRGLVTVIVIGDDDRPGHGWYELAESLGRDVSDRDALFHSELETVFAHADDEVPSTIF